MSLCLSLYHDNKFFVWADSRVSAEVGGKNYAVSDDCSKLRQIGSRVIFMSGMQEIIEEMFARIALDSSYEDIQQEARAIYNDFVAAHNDTPGYADSKHGIEFGIYLHEIVDGTPIYVQFVYNNNFEINKQTPSDADVFGVAAHSDVALPLFVRKINSSVLLEYAARRTFEYVADEVVGGYLTMFVIHPEGIASSRCTIRDRKPLRRFRDLSIPYRADMQGNVVARKITLTGTVENSSINTSTITAGTINGGTINGAQIIGGSITSNTDINVTRDVRVGNSIFLGLTGQTNDRRIEFVDSGPYRSYIGFTDQTKQLEIYSANDLRLNSGLDVTISAMRATLPNDSYLGSAAPSRKIVVQSDLANKADRSELTDKADRSAAGYNLVFDSSSRNLKMFSATGGLLATVNIPK